MYFLSWKYLESRKCDSRTTCLETRHRPTRDVFPLGRARAGKLRAHFWKRYAQINARHRLAVENLVLILLARIIQVSGNRAYSFPPRCSVRRNLFLFCRSVKSYLDRTRSIRIPLVELLIATFVMIAFDGQSGVNPIFFAADVIAHIRVAKRRQFTGGVLRSMSGRAGAVDDDLCILVGQERRS